MLVLGVTTKDKGTQLEALVLKELVSQGYVNVYANVVGSGGNELDVVGAREVEVMGATHVIPLLCEAKAYADPVDMPTWQKFLGKLFLERTEKPGTLGMLVALNGVNGNVRGSFMALRKKDESVFIFDGAQLLSRARDSGEIMLDDVVRSTTETLFRRRVSRLEAAYYGGGFFWIVWWDDVEYSVVDAYGHGLTAEDVERLRAALTDSVAGTLVAIDESRAIAEARHDILVSLMNQLFQGADVIVQSLNEEERNVCRSLTEEPYIAARSEGIKLRPADDLDGASVARLFTTLFENRVVVKHLDFMVGQHHNSYIQRLIDTLSERQSGFAVSEDDEDVIRAIAPLFPSVWLALSQPIPMIVTHRTDVPVTGDEDLLGADRTAFWDEIIKAVRRDFADVYLRGFLYDYVGLAEIQEKTKVTIKSKQGVIGSMQTELRTGIRQLSEEYRGEAGTRHILIRMLPHVPEPWADSHPDPIPLE